MDFPEIHKPRVVVFPFYNSDVVKNGPFHKRSDVYAPARPQCPSSYTTAREVRRSRSPDGADASMPWPASSVAGKERLIRSKVARSAEYGKDRVVGQGGTTKRRRWVAHWGVALTALGLTAGAIVPGASAGAVRSGARSSELAQARTALLVLTDMPSGWESTKAPNNPNST